MVSRAYFKNAIGRKFTSARIDSLCIVQDDEDDWSAEAAKMNDVYQNAAITLSADGATDTAGGLLPDQSIRASAQVVQTITLDDPVGGQSKYYARFRTNAPSLPNSFPHSSLDPKPTRLSTRGWVVQERILSQRMVHFYTDELVWSCHSQQRCECRLLPGISLTGPFRRFLAEAEAGTDLLIEWPDLVAKYTSKELTFEKDRLMAISGLAALMKQHTDSEYLAGLWDMDLPYSMLWMSDHKAAAKKPVRRMEAEHYAPTWSWASVIGPVKYIHRHLDQFSHRRSGEDEINPVFRVLNATTIPLTANVFGPVRYGFASAMGQVQPIFYDRQRRVWRPEARELSVIDVEIEPKSFIEEPRVEPKFIFDVLSEYSEDGDPVDGRTRGYALLRVATYLWQGQWSANSTEVVALLLSQVSLHPPAFMRAGLVLQAFDAVKVWTNVPTQVVTLT